MGFLGTPLSFVADRRRIRACSAGHSLRQASRQDEPLPHHIATTPGRLGFQPIVQTKAPHKVRRFWRIPRERQDIPAPESPCLRASCVVQRCPSRRSELECRNEQNFRHALAVCVHAPVHLLGGVGRNSFRRDSSSGQTFSCKRSARLANRAQLMAKRRRSGPATS
jgi:hypothetical protein